MSVSNLFQNIKFNINSSIFVKDPQSSELGKNIVAKSIELINQVGLEQFTFKKLAFELNTAESSIYRYFENKHKVLIYLVSWYWRFQYHSLILGTNNISKAPDKLKIALSIIANPEKMAMQIDVVNIPDLHQIIIAESSKTYLTKEIDKENKEGFFLAYKSFCTALAGIISEINKDYQYPNSLAATIIEGMHHQKFFKAHLPSLSDTKSNDLVDMFCTVILKTIK